MGVHVCVGEGVSVEPDEPPSYTPAVSGVWEVVCDM